MLATGPFNQRADAASGPGGPLLRASRRAAAATAPRRRYRDGRHAACSFPFSAAASAGRLYSVSPVEDLAPARLFLGRACQGDLHGITALTVGVVDPGLHVAFVLVAGPAFQVERIIDSVLPDDPV